MDKVKNKTKVLKRVEQKTKKKAKRKKVRKQMRKVLAQPNLPKGVNKKERRAKGESLWTKIKEAIKNRVESRRK